MTSPELLAELKAVIRETAVDPAWGDSRLYGWLAEAQDKFCEDTGYFSDISNFSITLATGVATYAIPDRVIQVLDIFDGTRRLGKFQEQDRSWGVSSDWDPSVDPTTAKTPSAWQTDRETGIITFNNTPTADDDSDEYTLRVWRYSQTELASDADPEIPSRFHHALVEYAAFKALMDHDMEKQDKVKAGDHLSAYNLYAQEAHTHFRRYHGVETRVATNLAYRV